MPDWTPPPYLANRQPRRTVATAPVIDMTADVPALPTLAPQRLTFNEIQFQRYSRIIPWSVVEYKLIPNVLTPNSNAPMDWEFDEPADDDDHEVRVFVSLSAEDVAIIKRHGYHHEPVERKVRVFGAADILALEELQQQELEIATTSAERAFLKIEHKQQLEWATKQEYDLTILDFLAAPFRRNFENRYQATLGQRDINGKLSAFKATLKKHYES